MALTAEQKVTVNWIKSLPYEEVAMYVDEAIELHDLWLEDLMWPETRPHPMVGWVPASRVAEVMTNGTTREEAFIQYLANLGLCKPRTEWDHPDEYAGWPQKNHLSHERTSEIVEVFHNSFNSYFAEPATVGALVRLRKNTGWVENHKDWGWRLTPDGLAHLDGILDEVVQLDLPAEI